MLEGRMINEVFEAFKADYLAAAESEAELEYREDIIRLMIEYMDDED